MHCAYKGMIGAVLCAYIAGCSGVPPSPTVDGPPQVYQGEISEIPGAVPRVEPLSKYGNPDSYEVHGERYYVLRDSAGYRKRGHASWYGRKFHGRRTSSGEPYDMYAMTAAHRSLPLPCYARVTNLENGRSTIVRINDRGPFHPNRIIDLSYAAAVKLDIIGNGTALVEVETIDASQELAPEPTQYVEDESAPQPPAAAVDTDSALDAGDLQKTFLPGNSAADFDQPRAIVKPLPPAAEPATIQYPALYLQVGAFRSPANANRMVDKLEDMGLDAAFILAPDQDSPLHRVRLGPYDNNAQMHAHRQQLTRNGIRPSTLRE